MLREPSSCKTWGRALWQGSQGPKKEWYQSQPWVLEAVSLSWLCSCLCRVCAGSAVGSAGRCYGLASRSAERVGGRGSPGDYRPLPLGPL